MEGIPWQPSGKESIWQSKGTGPIPGQGTEISQAKEQTKPPAMTAEPVHHWSPRATWTRSHMMQWRSCILQLRLDVAK